MFYVYLIKSLKDSSTYIGYTTNLDQRLKDYNAGKSKHTNENRPWEIVTYIAFTSEKSATEFEKYIKSGSGYAFAKKRLW